MKSLFKGDLKHCNDIGIRLREGENTDVQHLKLYQELQLLKSNSLNSEHLIRYILQKSLKKVYPNVYP